MNHEEAAIKAFIRSNRRVTMADDGSLSETAAPSIISSGAEVYPMRFPRFVLVVLGFLLIGMIGVSAVSYLHHLIYPDALSKSDVARAQAHTRVVRRLETKRIGNAALNPLDQPIDELGAHVQTEGDAKAYVEALVKRWGPEEAGPHLPEFEERLARAEYLAVRSPDKLIPESQVATTFNRLMDEWQMPGWTRISVPELREFRFLYATVIYPKSVARLPDQSIAPRCRPTEASFLLHMLNSKGGIPPEIREQVRDSRFPWSILKRLRSAQPAPKPIKPGLHPAPQTPGLRQEVAYMTCQHKYFASHPVSFENVVNDVFGQLGIPQN